MNYAEALDHVDRNGSLLWADCHHIEARRLFDRMEREGHIERNRWSGELHLTETGKRKLEAAR